MEVTENREARLDESRPGRGGVRAGNDRQFRVSGLPVGWAVTRI
jgi:hypothetical protein